jgi:mono/diheme cytochrome c family protein
LLFATGYGLTANDSGDIMVSLKRLLLLSVALGVSLGSAHAASRQVERGKYLMNIIPCTDCHTPGTFLGHPDMSRYLGGSEVGFEVPGLGVFYGPNLTPDKDTGLGKWTVRQIATAITNGVAPDGRKLAPPMPSEWFHHLTKADALAIAAYLKTIKPVKNQVPGPFGSTQKPTSFVFQIIPADKYVPTPPPPGK